MLQGSSIRKVIAVYRNFNRCYCWPLWELEGKIKERKQWITGQNNCLIPTVKHCVYEGGLWGKNYVYSSTLLGRNNHFFSSVLSCFYCSWNRKWCCFEQWRNYMFKNKQTNYWWNQKLQFPDLPVMSSRLKSQDFKNRFICCSGVLLNYYLILSSRCFSRIIPSGKLDSLLFCFFSYVICLKRIIFQ